MKKQFVTYEIALKLKKLGFDEECFGYYSSTGIFNEFLYYDDERTNKKLQLEYGGNDKECTAPLWQQAEDWISEELGILIHKYKVPGTSKVIWIMKSEMEYFLDTKEEAFLEALGL